MDRLQPPDPLFQVNGNISCFQKPFGTWSPTIP